MAFHMYAISMVKQELPANEHSSLFSSHSGREKSITTALYVTVFVYILVITGAITFSLLSRHVGGNSTTGDQLNLDPPSQSTTAHVKDTEVLASTSKMQDQEECSTSKSNDKEKIKCDDIFVGTWYETCFITAQSDGVFPGMQGVLSFPLIVTPATDGGFDYYGYSLSDPFFGGQDYWEIGHGQPSRVETPTPTNHCIASFSTKTRLSNRTNVEQEWDTDEADYVWNRISHDSIMVGNGKDATCFYERMYGNACRETRAMAIQKFGEVGISISLPSEAELCR